MKRVAEHDTHSLAQRVATIIAENKAAVKALVEGPIPVVPFVDEERLFDDMAEKFLAGVPYGRLSRRFAIYHSKDVFANCSSTSFEFWKRIAKWREQVEADSDFIQQHGGTKEQQATYAEHLAEIHASFRTEFVRRWNQCHPGVQGSWAYDLDFVVCYVDAE